VTLLLDQPTAPRAAVSGQLRVALVNNMPDSAFEETERQFRELLEPGSRDVAIVLDRYVLMGAHTKNHRAERADGYLDISRLYRCPPDALIVTGAEPKSRDLRDEAFWPVLEDLLWWASSEVPAGYLSCLAAHAGLLVFDGLQRKPLAEKRCGVFSQVIDRSDPVMNGIGSLRLAHSRWNDVPSAELVGQGYRVLAGSAKGGWALASAQRGQCTFLLSQGHPEYGPLTLLREYRRDVRRYLSGTQVTYPGIPVGYVDAEGIGLLEDFAMRAKSPADKSETGKSQSGKSQSGSAALMGTFPFEGASVHVTAGWQPGARLVFKNWLRSVRHMAHERSHGKQDA
jgi:homoserine O-succinyltransferase/O-acetyltransferase